MLVRSHPGDGAPGINEELVLGENIGDSDHVRQKLTKLTVRRRVTDANIRDVYTAGVV